MEKDMLVQKLDAKIYEKLDAFIAGTEDKQENVIRILHEAQLLFGYLPPEVQLHVAHAVDLPAAKINGIVTFYSYFTEKPIGKYRISICMGTACFVKGASAVLKELRDQLRPNEDGMSDDGLFSLREVRCLGACGLAPVLTVNDKIYGHVKPEDIKGLLTHYREESMADVTV
ncbi:MAG: NAD(P)H-dependent oxidoreductase subunit E [Bacillota bacterium]|jgi:NADH-quinone oxidoreductase subunit E|nr:NAD(P)H-dependent oxidoreductase subunit E [Bacillota bacterium]